MNSVGEARPRAAAKRVARLRSPVIRQAIARTIRPPSSGNAGQVEDEHEHVDPSQPGEHGGGAGDVGALAADRIPKPVGPGDRDAGAGADERDHERHQRARGGDLELGPGESESAPIRATPPNSHRVISVIGIPRRIATSA